MSGSRSCWRCGFRGQRSLTSVQEEGESLRCHYFDNPEGDGFLSIPRGEERNTAQKCQVYYEGSQDLTPGEFLLWHGSRRVNLHNKKLSDELDGIKEKARKQDRLISILGLVLTVFAAEWLRLFEVAGKLISSFF